jgi:D-beta-D-heptose 7-phosphate kinase/D-beta-D-heptose 1-phosphate adenosyltransferase
MNSAAVRDLINLGFRHPTVVVLGDVMVDRYVTGDVHRISPEAPVPVVLQRHDRITPGGAANVTRNLKGLGCQVRLCSITGTDEGRRWLESALESEGLPTDHLWGVNGVTTTTKTRVMAGQHQITRIDHERLLPESVANQFLLPMLPKVLLGAQALILSDYAKGVVSPAVAQAAIREARAHGIPVLVDPKGVNWDKYAGATAITPNTMELAQVLPDVGSTHEALDLGLQPLLRRLGVPQIICTRGEDGILVISAERPRLHAPAKAQRVFDVSGAGDTVIATLTACMSCGIPLNYAVPLANLAAGVVVGQPGTVPITSRELLKAFDLEHRLEMSPAHAKILSFPDAVLRAEAWRDRGERVVFTNGCFDILHAGHCRLLEQAKSLGTKLIVGLNDDASIRRLKGPNRPVNSLDDRANVLASLASVDAVIPFIEDTPLNLICALRPQVLVKGGDYIAASIVGAPEVLAWGGDVRILPLLAGRSTTAIIAASEP